MPVDTEHAKYRGVDYTLMDDVAAGEAQVKSKGATYLPKTPGQLAAEDDPNLDPDGNRYKVFRQMASFPDLVGPAVDAMIGLAHQGPAEFELTPKLQSMEQNATRDGQSLATVAARVTRYILLHGRCPILPDVDEQGIPYLSVYTGAALRNWRTAYAGMREKVVLAVLAEAYEKENPNDKYKADEETQYRVIELDPDSKGLKATVYRKDGGNWVSVEELVSQQLTALEEVPIVVPGSIDLTLEPDDPPLWAMAGECLKAYNISAHHKHLLRLMAQPTPTFTGIDKEDAPNGIGSEILNIFPDAGAQAFYMEVSGTGVAAMKEAERDHITSAMQYAAQLVPTFAGEAAESLRIKAGGRTATLASCVSMGAAGIEKALKFCAMMVGDDPDKVSYKPNLDFTRADVDATMLTLLHGMVMSGMVPRDVLWESLRRGKLTTLDNEELEAAIEQGAQTVAAQLGGGNGSSGGSGSGAGVDDSGNGDSGGAGDRDQKPA